MAPAAFLHSDKSGLRREALARRDALPAEERARAAAAIAARALPVAAAPGAIVSGYLPIGSEIDPLPLLQRFAQAGARLALPCVVGRGRPLAMRAWSLGAPLKPGPWGGLREPLADAPEVAPDILVVPLVGFDRAGHRIGYGAGYYDRTLASLRDRGPALAIGIAFAAQEIPKVPAMERDARLDLVLTEREAIDFRD